MKECGNTLKNYWNDLAAEAVFLLAKGIFLSVFKVLKVKTYLEIKVGKGKEKYPLLSEMDCLSPVPLYENTYYVKNTDYAFGWSEYDKRYEWYIKLGEVGRDLRWESVSLEQVIDGCPSEIQSEIIFHFDILV